MLIGRHRRPEAQYRTLFYPKNTNHRRKTYIGESRRRVSSRMKEHERAVILKHPEQSGIAEHHMETGHKILFENTSITTKASDFFFRNPQGVIEIKKTINNINRDKGY
ncbi:uncharacterized protein LOC105700203 [Orussus abietinus]|uniref:uncharacterized protein LOC105700203 n=1 Tax=Orussus abietinus TaxID=222816 RepID=UPI000626AEFE|nr:uncharacterized protein LOC105700203 [Orussus abietinus]